MNRVKESDRPRSSYPRCIAATLSVGVALALALVGPIWSEGFFGIVPRTNVDGYGVESRGGHRAVLVSDTTFVVASVRANAMAIVGGREILERPWCAPAKQAVVFSDPLLATGVVGAPGELIGRALGFAPTRVAGAHNAAILGGFLLKMLAISLLLFSWTGSIAAGIAGGATYTFNTPWLRDVSHFYIYDHSWVLFGAFFFWRYVQTERSASLVLATVATLLQLANCFYASLAAATIALPLAVWILSDRRRHPPAFPVLLALLVGAACAYLLLEPYFALEAAGREPTMFEPIFASPEDFLVGGSIYPGMWVYGLSLVGLCLPARFVLGAGQRDPRAALALGVVLCAWLAVGPQSSLPDLYGGLASVVPGLDSVRAPTRVSAGSWPGLAILVGMAVSGTLRLIPSQLAALGSAVVPGLVILLAVSGQLLAPIPYLVPHSVVIEPEENEFFDVLKELGAQGPLLEIPHGVSALLDSPRRMLLSTNHGMGTSACYGSTKPVAARGLADIAGRLPAEEAIRQAWSLGFRTILVHPRSYGRRLGPKFDRAAEDSEQLEYLATVRGANAYEIRE